MFIFGCCYWDKRLNKFVEKIIYISSLIVDDLYNLLCVFFPYATMFRILK